MTCSSPPHPTPPERSTPPRRVHPVLFLWTPNSVQPISPAPPCPLELGPPTTTSYTCLPRPLGLCPAHFPTPPTTPPPLGSLGELSCPEKALELPGLQPAVSDPLSQARKHALIAYVCAPVQSRSCCTHLAPLKRGELGEGPFCPSRNRLAVGSQDPCVLGVYLHRPNPGALEEN